MGRIRFKKKNPVKDKELGAFCSLRAHERSEVGQVRFLRDLSEAWGIDAAESGGTAGKKRRRIFCSRRYR